MKRFFPIVLAASGIVAAAACSSSSDDSGPSLPVPEAGADGPATDAQAADAGPRTTCTIEHAYATACGTADKLACPEDQFDSWCAGEDRIINSDAYRQGEAMCMTAANCDADVRHDCQYGSYAARTPTASQKSLVDAYCTQCEPADTAGCASRAITYDKTNVTDIFIAAWELSDALVDEIRTTCTGQADAGADAGTDSCAKTFSLCSGGIYLDRIPNCPQ